MAELKIIVEGYAREEKGVMFASPTTVLIKDSNKNILIDPGANKELLLKGLKKEGLKLENIDIVFISHYHPDHFLNIRLFPDKDIYDGSVIWSNDKETSYEDKIPSTNIKIIPTPGHSNEHCSLIVETDKGKVVIAVDVFWWMDHEEQKTDKRSLLNKEDPYATNKKELINSRKKLLEIADYIIPGHGKMFKFERHWILYYPFTLPIGINLQTLFEIPAFSAAIITSSTSLYAPPASSAKPENEVVLT